MERHVAKDAGFPAVALAFAAFFAATWGALRLLEWRGLYLRL